MRLQKWFPFLPVFLLCFVLSAGGGESFRILHHPRTGKPVSYSALPGDRRQVILPMQFRAKPREFRGIWIATYTNLDFPRTGTPYQFRQVYTETLRKIRNAGFNAVIFQIRPSCDAFYNSAIHPFSKSVRGEEGAGYASMDMLGFMIAEAHRQGLEFHAWLNPYRVAGVTSLSKIQYLRTLHPKNFARLHPEAVLEAPARQGRTLLLDPGLPLVRQHLLATVREIIWKYAPDAIHFDDYFYPYDYQGQADLATWRRYNRNPKLSLPDWRRGNVNLMVREVSALIRENNARQRKNIRFGISPFGIWLNRASTPEGSPTRGNESYKSNYSDSRFWIKNNWIDYIVPQLYWPFTQPKAPYAALADWWADTVCGTRVKLYIGIGVHQPIAADNTAELKNQILYNSRRPEIDGAVFYSFRRVFHPESETRRQAVGQVIRDCWKKSLPAPSAQARKK